MHNAINNALGQSQSTDLNPLPGMVRNNAGGWSFPTTDWSQLERFIILGTTGGTYYVGQQKLTLDNLDAVERCLSEDPKRVIDTVVAISQAGRAPSKDPALAVLALAVNRKEQRSFVSKSGKQVTVEEPSQACLLALAALPKVAETFTHLSHFLGYIKTSSKRGFGNGFMKGVARWYSDKSGKDLAYQIIKYKSRDGFAQRDAYRLVHPRRWVKPSDDAQSLVFDFIAKGRKVLPSEAELAALGLAQLGAFAQLHAADTKVDQAAQLVAQHRLPLEAVPTHLRGAAVYEAMLSHGGMKWLIRNLGNLGKLKLLSESRPDVVEKVLSRLTSEEALKGARIHPLDVLKALCVYRAGRGMKGQGKWEPISRVVDGLDEAFYKSFHYVKPSGKRIMLAVDVSGSMQGHEVSGFPGLSLHEGAAALALSIASVEKQSHFVTFDTKTRAVPLSPRQRLDDAVNTIRQGGWGGGTSLNSPIEYALEQRIPVDAFVVFTDNETWADEKFHATQSLQRYRQAMGIAAKVICIPMVANSVSTFNTDDAGVLEVVGFDSSVPAIISAFLSE